MADHESELDKHPVVERPRKPKGEPAAKTE